MSIKIKKIRKLVNNLLEQTDQNSHPINVKSIAEYLGIKVREDDLGDISGILFNDGKQVVIGVQQSDGEQRKRFTIAHEIGHYILHEHNSLYIDKVFPVRLRNHASSEAKYLEEIEANSFAAELLIPKTLVENEIELQREVIDYETEDIIGELANKYDVSKQAMTFRLMNLGFIRG